MGAPMPKPVTTATATAKSTPAKPVPPAPLRLDNARLIQVLTQVTPNRLDCGAAIWLLLDRSAKTIAVRKSYLDHFDSMFRNFEWFSSRKNQSDARVALIHGRPDDLASISVLSAAIEFNQRKVYVEDGFIHSVERPTSTKCHKTFRLGCSVLVDTNAVYYDATKVSCIEYELNSDLVISEAEIARAKKVISEIVRRKILKYNNQPLDFKLDKKGYREVVLVADQACNDQSIIKGYADKNTFIEMLDSAIKENPEALILVKVHPDMINNPNRGKVNNQYLGHYTDYSIPDNAKGRVQFIATYANCYSVLEHVDKVYVCTSQFGFEALMAGKEVHIWGSPFYAGWGLGVQRRTSPAIERRTKHRSLEEVFAVAYLHFSRYINPLTASRCQIEELILAMDELRAKYFKSQKLLATGYKSFKDPKVDEPIPVAFTFDENYALQALISILSLLDSDPENSYEIFCVLDEPIQEETKQLFEKYCKQHNNCSLLRFILPEEEAFAGAFESRHLNKSTYLRFELPNLIDRKRVIYSDIDVLFVGGLSGAWLDMPSSGYYVGACLDVGLNTMELFKKKSVQLPYWLPEFEFRRGQYVSGGFLVMNLDVIRKTDLMQRWRDLSANQYDHHDMDILNITCYPKIYNLSSRFCVIPRYLESDGYTKGINEKFMPEQEAYLVKDHPVILHYAGPRKPWTNPKEPGANLWWKFLKGYPELERMIVNKYAARLV